MNEKISTGNWDRTILLTSLYHHYDNCIFAGLHDPIDQQFNLYKPHFAYKIKSDTKNYE